MRQDAASLADFYASRLGAAAQLMMVQRIADLWGDCHGIEMLGIGYAEPVLAAYSQSARACVAASPEESGLTRWRPGPRGVANCLTREDRLPFGDGSFDRIVMLHALEETESPRTLIREAWRVLAPEGRLLIGVANRKSLWSLFEATPFGHGRPWTRGQLTRFLGDHLFQVSASTTAVHMPPLGWSMLTASVQAWERAGALLVPGLGGVVLVEAVKHMYAKPGGSAPAAVTSKVPGRKGVAQLPRNEADAKTPGESRQGPR